MAPLVKSEISREVPTFMRERHQPQREPVSRPRAFHHMEDDEEQYDIPTFLRKSVD